MRSPRMFQGGVKNMSLDFLTKQGLGCMGMSEFYGAPMPEGDAINLIKKAFEKGIRFFDTADVYAFGDNEKLLGAAVSDMLKNNIVRDRLVIATKCGILRDRNDTTKRGTDNSYGYVKSACDASLGRLGADVGYIDLYYIHRIANNGVQLDEAMRAMAELLREGKIKAVGLSEATEEQIRSANASLLKYTNSAHRISAVQSEYSLMTRIVEKNCVLNCCRELGITFVAYSPLSRALLTGQVETADQFPVDDFRRSLPRFSPENLAKNKAIVGKVTELASKKNCTTAQIALAWVVAQGAIPIPGTTKLANLESNLASNHVLFTTEELDQLNKLETASGTRYTDAAMKAYGFESELLTQQLQKTNGM